MKSWKNRFFVLERGSVLFVLTYYIINIFYTHHTSSHLLLGELCYYEKEIDQYPFGSNKKGSVSLRNMQVEENSNSSLVRLFSDGKGDRDLVMVIVIIIIINHHPTTLCVIQKIHRDDERMDWMIGITT